ncbi:hypothetical protein [uncultured Clostridium sp.]|uniref:hypothetical protein n=1 Tax=uncultured Clostridium sp. TaxID=59620 RepID=UPI0026F398E6|nr:hypothetical protein [uncultured Clostridium sp.]
MQIYTCDKSQLSYVKNCISRVYKRLFDYDCDLEPLTSFKPSNNLEESIIENMMCCLEGDKRKYIPIFDTVRIDTHHELEKLGIGSNANKYTIIISLEDSLDYIVAYLTKCDVKAIRNIDNYKELSKSLLTTYYDSKDININTNMLIGLDNNLDRYLYNLHNDYDNDARKIAIHFQRDILETSYMLLRIITGIFKHYSSSVIRSLGSCSAVLTSANYIDYNIVLENKEGIQPYTLNIGCFERFDYLKNLNYEWSKL